jgi:hypothetical protein
MGQVWHRCSHLRISRKEKLAATAIALSHTKNRSPGAKRETLRNENTTPIHVTHLPELVPSRDVQTQNTVWKQGNDDAAWIHNGIAAAERRIPK